MNTKVLLSLTAAALLASSASAQVFLTTNTGELGTVNVHTGVFTSIGHQTNVAGGIEMMGDIAYNNADGVLYGVTYSEQLVKISTLNASFNAVGAMTYSNSLEFLNYGVLASTQPGGREIYAINTGTGAAYDTKNFFGLSDAGKTIYDLVSAPGGSIGIFGTDSGNMWYWGNNGTDAVMLGATGFSAVYGLAWWEDSLWGFGHNARGDMSVFSIDLVTGAGTYSASITGGDFDNGAYVFGATSSAGGPAVPEPSTYGMIGATGLLGLIAIRHLKKARTANS